MQPVKVIAFDLDGTLLNSVKDVSRYSRNIIHQLADQGILIGLCSGRDMEQMEKLLPVWQMDDTASFLIANNGADYLNLQSGSRSRQPYVTRKDVQNLLDAVKKLPVSVGIIDGSRILWSRRSIHALVFSLFNKKIPAFSLQEQLPALADDAWPKVLITGSPASMKAVMKRTRKLRLKKIPTGRHLVEAVAQDVSKYEALKLAMEDFDFTSDEVLSFGDDINDIELLRRTQGVAMKNALPLVKEAAGRTTKYTNSQEGIAYHLNSLLLYDTCFNSPAQQDSSGQDSSVQPEIQQL